jgi:uncharacterized protein (PEP-CTERM system associated)
MGVAIVPLGSPARLTCAIAVCCLLGARIAMAFPDTDASNPSIIANPTPPTESDLRHQLQLQSGIGAAAAGGGAWTFQPAAGAEEYFTDNVLQSATNRRWDLVTVLTPSIAVIGNEPNAQVNFNYSPQFRLDARTPVENGLTQQLAGTGQFTVIPDAFYIDVRALAGGTPIAGGFGTLGAGQSLGASQLSGGIGTAGLAKQNLAQTSSASISPYYLHRFGDFGTAKIGYEINETTVSQNAGYIPLFIPTGTDSQHSLTNQAVAQFETGEQFAPYRYLVVANASQSTGSGVSHNSSQDTINNELGYEINRSISVYGNIGYEALQFGGVPPTRVDDMTWGFGATYQPNTDSQIKIGYGRQNGTTGVQFSGYYAITPRTRISAQYTTGLESDVTQLQGQLDLASLDQNGNAVDAQTGAPLFNAFGGIGAQGGLFRSKSFSMTASTVLDRDQISLSVQWSQQTTIATDNTLVSTNPFNPATPPVGSTSLGMTGILTWIRSLSEDLTLNSSASYGISNITGGSSTAGTASAGTGRQTSIGASVGLQYMLSQTLATNVRYTYFIRESPLPDQTIYENLFLVGINKQF